MIKASLQEANPELAKQWHPIKNGSLTSRDVTAAIRRCGGYVIKAMNGRPWLNLGIWVVVVQNVGVLKSLSALKIWL